MKSEELRPCAALRALVGARFFTCSTTAFRCTGVVPQQPPTNINAQVAAKCSNSFANDSGVSLNTALSADVFGEPHWESPNSSRPVLDRDTERFRPSAVGRWRIHPDACDRKGFQSSERRPIFSSHQHRPEGFDSSLAQDGHASLR